MSIVKQEPVYVCDHCGEQSQDKDTSEWLVLRVWGYDKGGIDARMFKHFCSPGCVAAWALSVNRPGRPLSERG